MKSSTYANLVIVAAFATLALACNRTSSVDARDAAPTLECGSDLRCVAKRARALEVAAESAARGDVASIARDLRSPLEANDCRAAIAADGRLDRLDLERSDASPIFRARVALMNELLNSCLMR